MKDLLKKIIPPFLIDWYHFLLSFLGAILYRFPSKKIKVIGVAGTDGKTTTVSLATKILEEAGYRVASLSSIRFIIGDKEWKNTLKMTTPGRFNLQKFLKQAVNNRCQYAVLEITDEGIKQHRHRFIDFDTAVLTNITPEHIETHGSFEKMREMNGKLFQIAKNNHIINLDDENAEYFLQFPAQKKINYQLNGNRISINGSVISINLKLLGKFNLYNAAAAICVGLSQGVDLEVCQRAVEKVEGIPGRMEVIIKKPFFVIVDYAHTVNALEKVYQTIQGSKFKIQNSKMICVLGSCGGGRDKWKRPEFGKIAARYCNEIILTNEDPYDENPLKIIEEIESGFSQIPNSTTSCFQQAGLPSPLIRAVAKFQIPKHEKILDRREAIKRALKLAKLNDIVIITGKGREPWMCFAKGRKIPWDDSQIVKEEMKKL